MERKIWFAPMRISATARLASRKRVTILREIAFRIANKTIRFAKQINEHSSRFANAHVFDGVPIVKIEHAVCSTLIIVFWTHPETNKRMAQRSPTARGILVNS